MRLPDSYIAKIKGRGCVSYIKGLLVRVPIFLKADFCRRWARMKGATIGEGSVISWKIARICNSNLVVGDDCVIDADHLDLRCKIIIGNHVIINKGVNIIRMSHYIDDNHYFTTRSYPNLIIDNYSWLSTGAKVLPQVTHIAVGTVVGAYSVLVKNTEKMGVYGGNPGKLLKHHSTLHDEILVCSLQGCDLLYYLKAMK